MKLASERAAALTRQLLTFSRKQIVQRKPLNLNTTISRMQSMLSRLLGETIRLDWQPAPALPAVNADDPSLNQIVMNLIVNARDAMVQGGTVKVSTRQTEVTAAQTWHRPDMRPGHFIVLTVTDTGCGMDTQTLSRLFEPFFTTKPIGKGTGLGLSTVYGIVKQHEGWIDVESRPGAGATFNVFLPVHDGPCEAELAPPDDAAPAAPARSDQETILVVEDEPAVREYVSAVLSQYGYQVLVAECGRSALAVWDTAPQPVDLLLTDMVMPDGMSGSMLASRLLERDPTLKVLYASGHSPDIIANGAALSEGLNFLSKPFNLERLLSSVRRTRHQSRGTTVSFGGSGFHVPVDEEIIQPAEHHHRPRQPEREAMILALHQAIVLTHLHAQPAQHRAPDRRAEDGEEGELQVIHPHDARRDADEMPHHRQQARDENTHRPVMRRPAFRALDFFRRDENVFAVAQEQRSPGQPRGPIHHRGAKPRADGSGQHDAPQAQRQLPRVREVRGGRDDDFAGQRKDGTFDGHEQGDQGIAAGLQRGRIPFGQRLDELMHRAWL